MEQDIQRLQKQYQDIEAQSGGNQQHPGPPEFLVNQAPAEVEHVNTLQIDTRDEEESNPDSSSMLANGAGIR